MVEKKKIRNVILTLAGIAIFIGVYSYIGIGDIISIMHDNLTILVIVFALLLTTINIIIRTYRWETILKALNPAKVDFLSLLGYTFAGSFLANITPGKVGELGKSYFLKKSHGIGHRHGLPSIMIDKLSDIIFTGAMAVFFFFYFVLKFKMSYTIMILAGFIAISVAGIFAFKIFSNRIMKIRLVDKFMKKKELNADEVNQIFKAMTRQGLILKILVATIVLWIIGAFRLMIIGNAMGLDLALIFYLMIITISLLIGGLSLIPAGIGVNDAVMIFLFNLMGGQLELYGAATLANTVLSVVFVNLIGGMLLITLFGKLRKK